MIDILNQIYAFISQNIMASATVVAIVLEFVFRLIPTKKPLSIAWLVRDVMFSVSNICAAAAAYLDKVLPQRTVEVKTEVK